MNSGRGGFTLVEVMVAMLLLAVGAAGLLTAMAQSGDHIAFARDHDRATRLAQRILDEARDAEQMREGTNNGDEGRFRWEVTIRRPEREDLQLMESEKEGQYVELFRIGVRVQWRDVPGGPLRHDVRLTTYRAALFTNSPFLSN